MEVVYITHIFWDVWTLGFENFGDIINTMTFDCCATLGICVT